MSALMRAFKGPSAADMVRSGTGPVYHYMRQALSVVDKLPDDVAGLLFINFTYGVETTPVGFYELTFVDRTNWHFYWHFKRDEALSYEEVLSIVDRNRLPPHERQFLDEQGSRDAWPEARTRKYQVTPTLYKSSKCVGGRHTECVTGPGTGSKEACSCSCHGLDGHAREVLTRMCENVEFRRVMIDLVHQQTLREERQKQ